ncbi:MAG: NAD(+)/NADH kinase [Clostridia bacterium]|nr:NAD(+)/NADH kinase [Clostridia bacterium]
MNILILANPTKKQSCDFADVLTRELTREGFGVYTSPENCQCSPDLAVILGGDGTVLRYLETVLGFSVPVLGVNFGHRGYLTSCEPENAKSKILEISKGKCSFESRMLFECTISDKDGKTKECFTGLNEAVLSRGGLCRAVDFTLYINGSSVISFPADGIIVATPTGSTAYNFSAQGPVLMPKSDNLVVTPICASSLLHSSIVTSGNDVIELCMCKEKMPFEDENPVLVSDGYKKFSVDFDDRIIIRRSDKVLKIYGVDSSDFLRVLEQKMM